MDNSPAVQNKLQVKAEKTLDYGRIFVVMGLCFCAASVVAVSFGLHNIAAVVTVSAFGLALTLVGLSRMLEAIFLLLKDKL